MARSPYGAPAQIQTPRSLTQNYSVTSDSRQNLALGKRRAPRCNSEKRCLGEVRKPSAVSRVSRNMPPAQSEPVLGNGGRLLEGETHDGDPVRIAAHDLSEATKGKQNVLEGIQGELLRNGALCHWQICYVLRALLRLP